MKQSRQQHIPYVGLLHRKLRVANENTRNTRQWLRCRLVVEEADARERHADAVFVACCDDVVVAY